VSRRARDRHREASVVRQASHRMEAFMGRKQDINSGATAACFVTAVIVGCASGSLWGAVVAFVVLFVILSGMKVIR
jgi:hypothetical protein